MPIPFPVKILVADDHGVVRNGLRLLLDQEADLKVVAEADDGTAAVDRCLAGDIDLAILDVAMPRLTGLQAARELARRCPEVRTLILSMYDKEQYFFEALAVGASGYVVKRAADRDIVGAEAIVRLVGDEGAVRGGDVVVDRDRVQRGAVDRRHSGVVLAGHDMGIGDDKVRRRRPAGSLDAEAAGRAEHPYHRATGAQDVWIVGARGIGWCDGHRRSGERGSRIDTTEGVEHRPRRGKQLVEAAQDRRALHVGPQLTGSRCVQGDRAEHPG